MMLLMAFLLLLLLLLRVQNFQAPTFLCGSEFVRELFVLVDDVSVRRQEAIEALKVRCAAVASVRRNLPVRDRLVEHPCLREHEASPRLGVAGGPVQVCCLLHELCRFFLILKREKSKHIKNTLFLYF